MIVKQSHMALVYNMVSYEYSLSLSNKKMITTIFTQIRLHYRKSKQITEKFEVYK